MNLNSNLDRTKTPNSSRLSSYFDDIQFIDLRVPERTLEVINFLNLAVRTHKPRTFDMRFGTPTNVALDVAQGRPSCRSQRTLTYNLMRSAQQARAAIAAQGQYKNQSYSYSRRPLGASCSHKNHSTKRGHLKFQPPR